MKLIGGYLNIYNFKPVDLMVGRATFDRIQRLTNKSISYEPPSPGSTATTGHADSTILHGVGSRVKDSQGSTMVVPGQPSTMKGRQSNEKTPMIIQQGVVVAKVFVTNCCDTEKMRLLLDRPNEKNPV